MSYMQNPLFNVFTLAATSHYRNWGGSIATEHSMAGSHSHYIFGALIQIGGASSPNYCYWVRDKITIQRSQIHYICTRIPPWWSWTGPKSHYPQTRIAIWRPQIRYFLALTFVGASGALPNATSENDKFHFGEWHTTPDLFHKHFAWGLVSSPIRFRALLWKSAWSFLKSCAETCLECLVQFRFRNPPLHHKVTSCCLFFGFQRVPFPLHIPQSSGYSAFIYCPMRTPVCFRDHCVLESASVTWIQW